MTTETLPEAPVWHELGLCTPPELVEAIANFLIDEDSNGVVIEDVDAGDLFADRRRMGWLWIRAYFQEPAMTALRERLDTYLEELAGLFPLSEPPVLDQRIPEIQDWSQCWRRFFRPQPITPRILVRPTWDEEPVPAGMQAVTLDPGMAFGTGKHPSTRLCIRALEDEVLHPTDDRKPKKVFSLLDVGTGSGILALAAARLGVPRVLGVDVDAEAVTAARTNISGNQLDHRVEVSDERVDEIIESFDVVMANIVADVLIGMKKDLVARLAPGGTLILSGILRNQGAWLKHEFLSQQLSFVTAHHDDEWCALVFERI